MAVIVLTWASIQGAAAAGVLEGIGDIWAVKEWQPLETHPLSVTGVATLVDRERGRLVVQNGGDVVAFDLRAANLDVKLGQHVAVKADDSWPALLAMPRYPLNPDVSEQLASFESRPSPLSFYVARFRGWVHPPVTGEYRFAIASDDSSRLLLGTDATPQSRRVIALVIGFTDERDWRRISSQRSEPIRLEAGRAYYIEAIHQQAGGGNHLSVAWEGPGIPLGVIDGAYLSPWEAAPGRHERPPAEFGVSPRGHILREVWENLTIDPAILVSPRKLVSSLVLREPTIEVLGAADWPEPRAGQFGERITAAENFRWTQVEGTVNYVARHGRRVVLELAQGAKRLDVIIPNSTDELPVQLRGRRVRVQGPGEALWNGDDMDLRRIWAPSAGSVTLLHEPPHVEFSRVTSIHELTNSSAELPDGTAVKVIGRVVRQEGNRLTVSDGSTFRAFTSADGANWIPLGLPVEVEMPERAQVGFAINSRSSEKVSEAVFTDVAGLPTNLHRVDVGNPKAAGSLSVESGRFRVAGAGSDIWNTPDQFAFFHAELAGDGAVVARLAELKLADPGARAGLMFRESLDPSAKFVQLVEMGEPNRWVTSVQWRGQTVGQSLHRVDAPPGATARGWLKLERKTTCIIVQSDTNSTFTTGTIVEVAGFVSREGGEPSLADAEVKRRGETRANHPVVNFWRPSLDIVSLLNGPLKWGGFDFFSLRGVVTFCGEVAGRRYWTIQDHSGAVLLQAGNSSTLFDVPAGTLVDVESNPGWRPPSDSFFVENVVQIGPAAMPTPIRHPAQYLLPNRGEGTWIEVEGTVRAASGDGLLEVKTDGEIFTVAIPGAARAALESYVDAEVRMRGAIVFPKEGERMLLVPSLDYVEQVRPPVADAFQQPLESARNLATEPLLKEARHRTRVAGVITLASPTIVFLQDERGGAQVELGGATDVPVGARVDAVGFPDLGNDGGVVLRHALLRDSGARVALEPDPQTDSAGAFRLVRIHGTVTVAQDDWVQLEAEGLTWRTARPANGDPFPAMPPGSLVEITGVHTPLTSEYPWIRPVARPSLQPAAQLLLRSAADVKVLATPTWWAVRRALIWFGLAGGIIVGGLVWIQILRRRVRQRSIELVAAMTKLETEVRMSATLAERDRLAGEIHDSVEQGLNGLIIQLQTTAELKNCAPDVRSQLMLARNMAAFGRSEVKHAIWELQSPLLEDADLPQAVHKMLNQTIPENLRATVKVEGEARRIGSTVEHHLLRLIQEAVNNTVKHAGAQNLTVQLRFEPDAVMVTVADDGCGFDPDNRNFARLGHFGLSGMRSRVNKLGAELDIVSSPGRGTQVRVRVPARPSPSSP